MSQLVEEAEPGSSPLEKKLARLSGQLVWATLILPRCIAGIGLTTGKDPFLMVEAAIALAVAAIPEGLPIVATLALARGMWRMARQNALIERLSAVETLGATTVILTDKTGTLTENRMTVRRLWVPSGEIELDASGDAERRAARRRRAALAAPRDRRALQRRRARQRRTSKAAAIRWSWRCCAPASRAGLNRSALLRAQPDRAQARLRQRHQDDGDGASPRRRAFWSRSRARRKRCWPQPSKSSRPTATTAARRRDARGWLARMSSSSASTACACWPAPEDRRRSRRARPTTTLTFARPRSAWTIRRAPTCRKPSRTARSAGIRVVMVTGDHAVTARSIGRAVGLGGSAANVVEGRELSSGVADGKNGELFDADIFARVSPAEKLELVRAYQAAGEIVAMTGDGVNDAPALRQADIGVAMGLRGTDVAREAAAMILLDDAFPTIVKAIREGRVIFGNIRRFVAYLLSCNLSEVLVVGLAVLSTLPLPLLPLQILYLNLVTDVFPAFALAMGEGEPGILKRPPRDPQEPILGRRAMDRHRAAEPWH